MVAFLDPTPAGARKVSTRLPPVLSRSAHLRKDMVWAGLKTAKSYRGLYTKTAGHRKLAFIYLVSEWLRCKNSTSRTSMADGGSGAPNYRRFLA